MPLRTNVTKLPLLLRMHSAFRTYLLQLTLAIHIEEVELLQTLWSGYGSILRYRLAGARFSTVVVKHIDLNGSIAHPHGWNTSRSHARKEQSYQIEKHWYATYSRHCGDACRVPRYLGHFSKDNQQWIILEDLDLNYPQREDHLGFSEALPCIQWLAAFHARFLHHEVSGLWEVGSYWHLTTRPDELERMNYSLLKAKAQVIDHALNNAKFKTIIHGDAKLANFCFSAEGNKVAALDFQYVGGGVGVKDLACFLGSCFNSVECERLEEATLKAYFDALNAELDVLASEVNRKALEQEWRMLYPFAIADFTRFLMGWMPEHHKVNAYNLQTTKKLLSRL